MTNYNDRIHDALALTNILVEKAIGDIREVAYTVIGSYANGLATEESDIDILLIYTRPLLDLATVSDTKTRFFHQFDDIGVDVTAYSMIDYAKMYGDSNVLYDAIRTEWIVDRTYGNMLVPGVGINKTRVAYQYLRQLESSNDNPLRALWLQETIKALLAADDPLTVPLRLHIDPATVTINSNIDIPHIPYNYNAVMRDMWLQHWINHVNERLF